MQALGLSWDEVHDEAERLEHHLSEALEARIDDAARFHPKERLAIATQCGFASAAETAEARRITEQTQRDKLRLVAQVARDVWG
jgi:5-methyltetrahydropteroyltriglutamate--homocysteine methyltransferase